ncbi:MAG TPA: sigma-70 family RNA polymerase sigma factor [Gammaproteobacteria bacterium]|nr:sigma-70 family RNA polymerase sigma factor [Gammaproteobacteria bacterium]
MELVTTAQPADHSVIPLEAGLVARARKGDARAFEQLYRRHAGRVYAVCLRLSGNRAHAEEFTQDAFVKAWQSLAAFRGDSGFGTWLHRIAVNTTLAHFRRNAKYVDVPTPVEDEAPDEEPGTMLDLEGAIAQLPDGAREVFVLHDVEGYKHDEIASLVGISDGTSKAQLHRARKLLRARLTR